MGMIEVRSRKNVHLKINFETSTSLGSISSRAGVNEPPLKPPKAHTSLTRVQSFSLGRMRPDRPDPRERRKSSLHFSDFSMSRSPAMSHKLTFGTLFRGAFGQLLGLHCVSFDNSFFPKMRMPRPVRDLTHSGAHLDGLLTHYIPSPPQKGYCFYYPSPPLAQQRGLMSRMRLRKVESTEILFETRENERWRPLSRRP